MKKWKITCISDTHNKHKCLDGFLDGGDMLIHAGDVSGRGWIEEIIDFCRWYDDVPNFDNKLFIAGNHDWGFQRESDKIKGLLTGYKTIDYLEDELMILDNSDQPKPLKIWGTPWQPEFYNWAFNLKRGEELKEKWDLIPNDIDILIVHGPAYGKLDFVPYDSQNVGCTDLLDKIKQIKPKIVVSGHIHEDYGYVFDGDTHFINASILDGSYVYRNKPLKFEWDQETNEIVFL